MIDHLGKPPIGTDEMPDGEAELRAAAAHPNVAAKVSGLNTCVRRRGWTASDLGPAVEVALDCFGADRLLFGTDWPVCLLNGSSAGASTRPAGRRRRHPRMPTLFSAAPRAASTVSTESRRDHSQHWEGRWPRR